MTFRGSKILAAAAFAVVGFAASSFAQDARYIVKFRSGRSVAGHAALRAAGAQVALSLDPQDAAAVHIPAAALNGLSRNPNIEYIEADVIREPYATWSNAPGVNGETVPYGIQMVQADKVTSSGAAGVTLCIIDSGYSIGHEDLRDTNVTFTSNAGSKTPTKDSCGHGSHVAGTVSAIAGNGDGVVGVNPGVSLHVVKVFGNDTLVEDGSCSWTYSSTLVNALNACTAPGVNAKVVSMSLGGGARSRTEENAFNAANNAGVLSIAAAGNAGNGSTSYPAGYASVMSVAAVDANEARASFSQKNSDVEIAAPGVSVLSTTPWLDSNTLTSGADIWAGGRLEGAPRNTNFSGAIVDGGQCTSAGSWSGKVVLCQRGTNSFAQKVAAVQSGGGAAAVIYNHAASDPTCGVFSGTLNGETSIGAITLSCADGADAKTAVNSTGTVRSAFQAPASGYEAWDGTSMATPHVSAVAALVWSCHPGKSNHEIRNALNKTAKDKGTAGRDSSYGFGIVQAKDALTKTPAEGGLGLGGCSVQ
jgi:serine protease